MTKKIKDLDTDITKTDLGNNQEKNEEAGEKVTKLDNNSRLSSARNKKGKFAEANDSQMQGRLTNAQRNAAMAREEKFWKK